MVWMLHGSCVSERPAGGLAASATLYCESVIAHSDLQFLL